MATPESRIKAKLDRMLKACGVWFFSPQAGPYGRAGVPDRIAIVCGTFVGIECKAGAQRSLTALQERTRVKIVEAGGVFFTANDDASIEEIREFIIQRTGYRGET